MTTTRSVISALAAGAMATIGAVAFDSSADAVAKKATTTKATTTKAKATTTKAAAATTAPPVTTATSGPVGLDATFGKGGIANVAMSASEHDRVTTAAIGADGKIYAGGYITAGGDQSFAVIRVDATGALDKTFGTNGVASLNVAVGGKLVEQVRGIAVQSNGKVVVVGPIEKDPTGAGNLGRDIDAALVRFDVNGNVDTTFGNNGVARVDFGPGKAISATAFSGDNAWGLDVTANDRLFVVGQTTAVEADRVDTDFALALFSPSGAPVAGFGRNGVVVVDIGLFGVDNARNAAVQPDGKLLATGYSRDGDGVVNQVLIRLDPTTGARDTSFGSNGIVSGRPMGSSSGAVSESYAVAQQPDGFVMFGYGTSGPTDSAKLDLIGGRYTSSGAYDKTWGTNGAIRYDLKGEDDRARWAVGLPDGRLLAAGSAKPTATNLEALVVLRAKDGSPVTTFGNAGAIVSDLGGPGDVWFGGALTPNKKQVVVVGYKGTDANSGGNDDAFVARINV